jgi:hypothetical protein
MVAAPQQPVPAGAIIITRTKIRPRAINKRPGIARKGLDIDRGFFTLSCHSFRVFIVSQSQREGIAQAAAVTPQQPLRGEWSKPCFGIADGAEAIRHHQH